MAGCAEAAPPPLFLVDGASVPKEWVATYPEAILLRRELGLATEDPLPPDGMESIQERLVEEVVASRQALLRGFRVSRQHALIAYVRWGGLSFEGSLEETNRYLRSQGISPEDVLTHLRRRILAEMAFAAYMGATDGEIRLFCEDEWETVVFHYQAYAREAGEEGVEEPPEEWALSYCGSAFRQRQADDPHLRSRAREAIARGVIVRTP